MSENETNSPKVYSYGRFSTPEQALGDSERRQIDNAKAYAKRIGVDFDEKLSLFDKSSSGYKGHNLRAGSALAGFLEKVKVGAVEEGSVLVVENVDRITRLDYLAATDIINGILKAGIKIHTLSPEMTYDRDIGKNGAAYMLVAQIGLAHAESAKKSERLKEVWEQKRKKVLEGVVATVRIKAWLEMIDGKLEPREGARKTLTALFEYKRDGLSVSAITRKLNQTAVWVPRQSKKRKNHGWNDSYVQKILTDRAVIGEYQMYRKLHDGRRVAEEDPIEGYYPAVVERGLFEEVQVKLDAIRKRHVNGGGAAADKGSNLFSEIAKCGYCGGAMHRKNKGVSREDKRGKEYLVCYNGARAAKNPDTGERLCPKPYSAAYIDFEKAVLAECRKLKPEHILPNENECQQEAEQVTMRIAGLRGQIEDNLKREANINDAIEKHGYTDSLGDRLTKLETERPELEAQLLEAEKLLKELQIGLRDFKERQKDFCSLLELIYGDDDEARISARLKLRSHLLTLIDRVEIFAEGTGKERDERLETFSEFIDQIASAEVPEGETYIDISYRAPNCPMFMKYARMRLEGKEIKKTCFYRIYFRRDSSAERSKRMLERGKYNLVQWETSVTQFSRILEDFTDLRKAPLWEPKPLALALLEPRTI